MLDKEIVSDEGNNMKVTDSKTKNGLTDVNEIKRYYKTLSKSVDDKQGFYLRVVVESLIKLDIT